MVTRGNLQKDGSTLVHTTMIRYVESVMTVVRSIIESRAPSPRKITETDENDNEETPAWDNTIVRYLLLLGCLGCGG